MYTAPFKIFAAITLFSLSLVLSGCPDSPSPDPSAYPIDRVISLSPNITQIIFALGAEEHLVGVDDYSIYPDAARNIPRMGTYIDPDLESLIAADPTWVFILNTDEGINADLDSLGIRYIAYGNDTLSEVHACIGQLGHIFDREDKASELTSRLGNACINTRSELAGVEHKTVAMIVGRNPGRLQDIYVVGGGNFLGELIETAGGENVFADEPVPWPQIGVESLIGTDPDIIIDSTLAKGASDAEYEALLKDWDDLPTLTAVKNGNVIIARDGWFQIPGAYLDSTLLLFAHWFHPDIFPDKPSDPNL